MLFLYVKELFKEILTLNARTRVQWKLCLSCCDLNLALFI